MNITFKYNNKVWNPKNPEKKLKQLGITWDDVEIITTAPKEEIKEELLNPTIYEFKNSKGEIILSIYDNLKHLKGIHNIEEYEYIGQVKYK